MKVAIASLFFVICLFAAMFVLVKVELRREEKNRKKDNKSL